MVLREGESWTEVFDGKLRVIQHARGYRLSLEAMLLSHFCRELEGRVVEIGTGSGVVSMAMASLGRAGRVDALEVQAEVADRARRGVEAAGLGERVVVHAVDARAFEGRGYDAVVSNPPYFKLGSGAVNPESERAISRHEVKLSLADLVEASRRLLGPRGQVCVCYPTQRAAELLVALSGVGLEPRRMRFVHPAPGERSRFALVMAQRGAGSELVVESPMFVRPEATRGGNHREGYCKEVQDILCGVW